MSSNKVRPLPPPSSRLGTPRTPGTPQIRVHTPKKPPKKQDDVDRYIYLYPPVPVHIAQACFIMNCIIPGSGTLVMTFAVCCCSYSEEWPSGGDRCFAVFLGIIISILQLALAAAIVGWVWSIVWGVKYVYYAKKREGILEEDEEDRVPDPRPPRHLPPRRRQSLHPHLFADEPDSRPSTQSSLTSGKKVSFGPPKSRAIDRDDDSGVPASPFPYLDPDEAPSPILPETYRPPTGRSVDSL